MAQQTPHGFEIAAASLSVQLDRKMAEQVHVHQETGFGLDEGADLNREARCVSAAATLVRKQQRARLTGQSR